MDEILRRVVASIEDSDSYGFRRQSDGARRLAVNQEAELKAG